MDEEIDYAGEVEVVHCLTYLQEQVGWEKIKEQVKVPMTDFKIATNIPTYYFTQLLAVALGLSTENCHFELNDPRSVELLQSKKCLAAA
jgi:heterodisulfide reductase subunit B